MRSSHLPSTLVATIILWEAVPSIQSPFAKQITLINPLSLTYSPPNTYPFPFSSKFCRHHVDISWWWCDGRLQPSAQPFPDPLEVAAQLDCGCCCSRILFVLCFGLLGLGLFSSLLQIWRFSVFVWFQFWVVVAARDGGLWWG